MNLERLNWKQLSVFCDAMKGTTSFQRNVIEQRFNANSLYFDEVLGLLLELELISDTGQNLLPNEEFREIVTQTPDNIKSFLISQLLKNRDFLSRYIAEFLNRFHLTPMLASVGTN